MAQHRKPDQTEQSPADKAQRVSVKEATKAFKTSKDTVKAQKAKVSDANMRRRAAEGKLAASNPSYNKSSRTGDVNPATVPSKAKGRKGKPGYKLVVTKRSSSGGSVETHEWEKATPKENLVEPGLSSRKAGGGKRTVRPEARDTQNKMNASFRAGFAQGRDRSGQTRFYPDSPGGDKPDLARGPDVGPTAAEVDEPQKYDLILRTVPIGDSSDAKHVHDRVAIRAVLIDQALEAQDPGMSPQKRRKQAMSDAIDTLPRGANKILTKPGKMIDETFGDRANPIGNYDKISMVVNPKTGLPQDKPKRTGLSPAQQQLAAKFRASRPPTTIEKTNQAAPGQLRGVNDAETLETIRKDRKTKKSSVSTKGGLAKPRMGEKGETKGLQSEGRGVGLPAARKFTGEEKAKIDKKEANMLKKSPQLTPGQVISKTKVSSSQFLKTVAPEEKTWIDSQFEYGGLFHGAKGNQVPGAYRRWNRYVTARSAGFKDRDNIQQWLTADNRGKRSSTTDPNRKLKSTTDNLLKNRVTEGATKPKGRTAKDRYNSGAPSHEEFGVGIRIPGIPSDAQLKDMFPEASDQDIFQIKESAQQSLEEEFLQNQRQLHEQRTAQLLSKGKAESAADNKDRVVFFTSSTGWPAISVGSNSLVGQYIIKKRKRMLYDNKMASRAELKGEFPYAVRDQHVVEAASGLSVGAQGRYGAFKHAGYRAGSKKSKGYGKMLPVGAQMLRDSSGQPLYDKNGNLRYTEGFTRPFDVRPSNEVGLRVYIG